MLGDGLEVKAQMFVCVSVCDCVAHLSNGTRVQTT